MKVGDPPAVVPEVLAQLAFADACVQAISDEVPDTISGTDDVFVHGLFSTVAMQHLQAIILLTRNNGTPASAHALFRPLVETTLRARYIWLGGPARAAEFLGQERYVFPKFKVLVGGLVEAGGDDGYYKAFTTIYPMMCDFTHTGRVQLTNQYSERGIGPRDLPKQDAMLVREAAKLTLFFFIEALDKFGESAAGDRLAAFAESVLIPAISQ